MSESLAARVVDGVVADVIVGTVEWATSALGGDWHDVTDLGVGRGWARVDGEWRYSSPYPSWVWRDGDWHSPVPEPTEPADEGYYWEWDEDAGEWVQVEVVVPPFFVARDADEA
jgi:hypothetical protein